MTRSIDDWDRYEVVRYLEEILQEKTGSCKIRVTSIKETVTRKEIFVHYEIVRSTSRFKNPEPDRTYIFKFDVVESHMKSYERDIKLKEILEIND
jgi:hypothetical protein